ncbi:MAG: hypothetical protein HC851_23590, partial [Acaryochloris sp. RU_4_1]|nr:hypothetical protein [Acaryochloris sp. RU_4_1]
MSSYLTSDTPYPVLPDRFEIWQKTLNWQPNLEQTAQFQQLYECILDGNRQLNLTRITDPTEFWEKHLWDSLCGIRGFLQVPGARSQGLEELENKKTRGQEIADREPEHPPSSVLHPPSSVLH